MVVPAAVLEAGRAVGATLLGPAGTRGFRFKAKPVVVVEEEAAAVVVVVVVVVVVLVVEAPGAAPGALRLKPKVPALGVAAVVTGAEWESTVALDEAGAAAMEAKSVGPALVVAAVGAAAGCVAPAVVVPRVAGVKGEPDSAVGCAELPTEPMLKPEAPGWDALPLVKENPVEPVVGAEVAEEPKTKPVGAAPWLEVLELEMALARVLLPSPKLPVLAVAGVAAVLPRLSFGVIPREKPAPPEAGVVPKLNPGV